MTVCAYCKQDRQATREHVIPAFTYAFQQQLEQSVIGWNEVVQGMVRGEAKVKDVCAECNNGTLSELDSYGKRLLSDSGLFVQNYTKKTLTLRYDYAPLLRWLLKVSFNSSRTDGAHSSLFEDYIAFVRGQSTPPPRYRVACLAYLAAPEVFGKSRIAEESFARVSGGSKLLNPFLVRICYGGIPGEHEYTLRLNIFGPAVFYLLLFRDGVLPGHAASAVRRLLKVVPGAVEITPKLRFVELQAGRKSWLDLYEYQVQRNRAIAEDA